MRSTVTIQTQGTAQRAALLLVLLLQWALPALGQGLTERWEIPADGSREYVSASAFERGMALNPATGHLLIASRASGVQIAILNATNGTEIGFLNVDGIAGGTFPIGCIAVADDGRIYAVNISGSAAVPADLRIYRWNTEGAAPVLVFKGNPQPGQNGRWGESLALRRAGAQTQLLMGASAAAAVALFSYSDSSQTAFLSSPFTVAGADVGAFARGLAFGVGDTAFGTGADSTSIHQIRFNPLAAGPIAANVLSDLNAGNSPRGLAFNPTTSRLAVLDTGLHQVRLYDASSLNGLGLLGQISMPSPPSPNVNGLGQVILATGSLYALEAQNGVVACDVSGTLPGSVPEFLSQPVSVDSLEGSPVTFSVSAIGSAPLLYQWTLNGNAIAGATNRLLAIETAGMEAAGVYQVAVRNAFGTNLSQEASLTLAEVVRSAEATRLWTVSPGTRPHFPSGLSRVGVAWNPASKSLIFLSTPTNALSVINPANGDLIRSLGLPAELSGASSISLGSVAVSDDGVVYACSWTGDAKVTPLRVYRWESDKAGVVPQLAFNGDPGLGQPDLWGDTLALRGSGTNTQLLLSSRTGSRLALLSASPGGFAVRRIAFDVAPGAIGYGLAFKGSNSFLAKAYGSPLIEGSWPVAGATGQIVRSFSEPSYPSSVSALAFVPAKSWVVGLDGDTPQHLNIDDYAPQGGPLRIDTEFFGVSGVNQGNEGSVAASADRLFAATPDAGLLAVMIGAPAQRPVLGVALLGSSLRFSWQGSFVLQTASNPEGPWTDLSGVSNGQTVSVLSGTARFFRLRD